MGRHTPPQIIIPGLVHFDRNQIADRQSSGAFINEQIAVNLRGIGLGATCGDAVLVYVIHDDLADLADLGLQLGLGNSLGLFHEPLPALLLDLFCNIGGALLVR